MANKSRTSAQSRKPGRTLKERRAAKHAEQTATTEAHKAWDK